jgi:hypothetical protein
MKAHHLHGFGGWGEGGKLRCARKSVKRTECQSMTLDNMPQFSFFLPSLYCAIDGVDRKGMHKVEASL